MESAFDELSSLFSTRTTPILTPGLGRGDKNGESHESDFRTCVVINVNPTPAILCLTLLHGLLVLAVVLQLDQFHLRLSCPPFLFSAKFKLNVSGVRTPTCV